MRALDHGKFSAWGVRTRPRRTETWLSGALALAGRGREGTKRLRTELLETTQKDTLPHPPEGVKVVGQVVDRQQRRAP